MGTSRDFIQMRLLPPRLFPILLSAVSSRMGRPIEFCDLSIATRNLKQLSHTLKILLVNEANCRASLISFLKQSRRQTLTALSVPEAEVT